VKGQAAGDGASKFNSGKNKVSALDGVLDSIKGPKTVSTVAKSNYDWETYKEKEGLEDELSAAAKDG
jgi:Bucentaur or craniofacial development